MTKILAGGFRRFINPYYCRSSFRCDVLVNRPPLVDFFLIFFRRPCELAGTALVYVGGRVATAHYRKGVSPRVGNRRT